VRGAKLDLKDILLLHICLRSRISIASISNTMKRGNQCHVHFACSRMVSLKLGMDLMNLVSSANHSRKGEECKMLVGRSLTYTRNRIDPRMLP
jgi:hypothetical protein